MTSSLYVSAVSDCRSVLCREVSIGGPSNAYKPNDVDTFYGEYITVKNNKGKTILSVRGGEVSIYKNSGEIVALGEYVSVDNGPNTLSSYNAELCLDPITGNVVVIGSGSLTADGEKTISLINAKDKRGTTVSAISGSFHTIPGKITSLSGTNVGIKRCDYPMNITVLGEKSEGGTKAQLNIDEKDDTVSLDGGVIVFKHGKASISVTDGNARIDMPNDYTSLNGQSIVLRYGDQYELFVSDIGMCIDHAESKIHLSGSDANFRIGGATRFVPNVKDACINLANGKVYCNGEMVFRAPLLKELGSLFEAGPKPASALTS